MHHRPTYPFERFTATRRIQALCPAPDGDSFLFVSDISGQLNLWRLPAQGGWPEQLTLYTEQSVRRAAYSPQGDRIAFLADHHGDEKYQVYLMDGQGGWPEPITDRPDVQYDLSPGAFSPCGRYLAFSGNATNPQDVDIYLYDLTSGESRPLTNGGGLHYFTSFSPDATKLLAVRMKGNTHQELLLIDLASGESQNLTAQSGRAAKFFPGPWLGDGAGFFLSSNDGREFSAIGYYDLAAAKWSYVVTADWEIVGMALNHDQSLLAYLVNEAGNTRLHVIDRESGRSLDLPPMPMGVIAEISFAPQDGQNRLFLQMATYAAAGNAYLLDLQRQELTAVTQSMLGNLPPATFAAPELVHIESTDGVQVPAWLYKPHGIAPGERVPALLSIHGGPEAQETTAFSYLYQYLLNQGIAILAPNIRGSTGFGLAYQKLIYRDWGGGDLRDIAACNHFLRSLDWIDGDRIGIFGGFATLSAITRLPDLWAAGVDICGPSNLLTFVGSLPPQWRGLLKNWLGDAEEDRDFLIERSPITYVDQVQAPLLVIQGATDPRVVKAESDQMVERLRSLGREVAYIVFEDEGHGFTKKVNQVKAFGETAAFLIRHLKA